MNPYRLAIVGLLALSSSACLPVTTKTPVGSTAGFVNDSVLEGTWVGKVDDSDTAVTYFHFIANRDNTLTVVIVGPPKQPKVNMGWQIYTLKTTILGGHRFMNARTVFGNGKPATRDMRKINIVLLYTTGKDTLTLYLPDEKTMEKAVAAHRIAGTSRNGDLTLTADAVHLDAFMKAPDAPALFSQWMVLKKLS